MHRLDDQLRSGPLLRRDWPRPTRTPRLILTDITNYIYGRGGWSVRLSDPRSKIARMFEPVSQSAKHGLHSSLELLVLPETNNFPPCTGQGRVCCAIPFDIAAKLRRPVPLVGSRLPTVYRTDMPEAPVHEHGDFAGGENDVWADLHGANFQAKVLAVAVPTSMQGAAKRHLGLGVGSPVRLHVARAASIKRSRIQASLMRRPPGHLRLALSHVHSGCTRKDALRKDTPHDWPGRRRPRHRKASL